ncbi:MAG TPA: hypothetical protein VKM55_11425 [Candidatus Lokiarchaeia archaeon]|nr:hypothetical protein [Candidatus Lokiarchaeia archaeon]
MEDEPELPTETEKIEKIKDLINQKFQAVTELENGEFAIILKEELVDLETQKRNYEIGLGKIMKFPGKLSVNGRTYRTDELDDIKEGSVLIPIKEITKRSDPRFSYSLVKVSKQFYRAVDEAVWAGNFKTLDDIIAVIDAFEA